MNTYEMIENKIIEIVKQVTGIKKIDKSDNLVDKKLNIIPADFLYIFEILEETFGPNIYSIFQNNGYDVMVIKNLAKAIELLQ